MLAAAVDDRKLSYATFMYYHKVTTLRKRARTATAAMLETKLETKVTQLRRLPKPVGHVPASDAVERVFAVSLYDTLTAFSKGR